MKKLFYLLTLVIYFTNAQNVPQIVVIVAPQTACAPGETVTLEAVYTQVRSPNQNYTVQQINYQPLFPFLGGQLFDNNADDRWSPTFPLPFPFCFYGQSYNSCLVGTNSVVTFNNGITNHMPDGFCPWSFSQTIPNEGFPIRNAIYGVYQDTDRRPTPAGPLVNPATQNVNWFITGTAPNRRFVANFTELPQFGCGATAGLQTSQIVLYEGTNVIDVYVEKRTPCLSWQNGVGVIGIQNAAGNIAHVPPGRNTGAWTANQEAWRFTPNDAIVVPTITWLDSNGNVLGQGNTIDVSPTVASTYTAVVSWIICGEPFTVSGQGTVTFLESDLNDPEDFTFCENTAPQTVNLTSNIPIALGSVSAGAFDGIYFHTSEADAENLANPIPNPSAFVANGPQTIYMSFPYINFNCIEIRSFDINFVDCTLNPLPQDMSLCDTDNDGFATFDLTLQNANSLNGVPAADHTVTYHLTAADAQNNVSPINPANSFSANNGTVIHVRVQSNTIAASFGVSSFTLNVFSTPVPDSPSNVTVCNNYVLPSLTVGNYFSGPNGTGTPYTAGQSITSSMTMYVYAETGTTPNCTAENSFDITIVTPPNVDTPSNVTACDSYTLPGLTVGNYFSAPNGAG
ncbi:MAG: hypothetical protein KGZ81_08675, partial [Flavobacteriales bacterium]|nr:hypothetical protein [Flavobacteriales bacterium]